MEVSGQNGFKCDEEKALSSLLDAFGSKFSLDEIASSYCKANRDVNRAGEILSEMQRSSSASTTNSPNADDVVEAYSGSKPKVCPVSVGTVSSRLGKDYVRSMPSANRSYHETTKPLKLDANLLTMSEIWADKSEPDIPNHYQLHQEMEDFLFKMLGHGFQLDREKIREILENCGYDIKKIIQGMDKLMDSILTFAKEAPVVGKSSTCSTDRKPKSEVPSYERKSQNGGYLGNLTSNKGVDLHSQRNDKEKLEKEVLTLFQVAGHSQEPPKKITRVVRKLPSYRKVVSEPPEDSRAEFNIDTNFSPQENIDPEDEEEYQNLRKAVKEYRAAMTEYFRAAFDAYRNGDKDKAQKLVYQGQVYLAKAREADEKSSKMIVETKNEESQEFVVDLHDCTVQGVIRSINTHLTHVSGIPSFEYLKVIIDASNQDVTQSSKSQKRKRRIIEKLEEESINWTEGDTVGTILINLGKKDTKH